MEALTITAWELLDQLRIRVPVDLVMLSQLTPSLKPWLGNRVDSTFVCLNKKLSIAPTQPELITTTTTSVALVAI